MWLAVWLELSTRVKRHGWACAMQITQYTLLEWFSGFNHSILKVFLHKYRRYVTNWIQTPLFIDRLPSLTFYFYNFLLRQNEYWTENFKNVLLIGQALVNRNSTVGNVWKLTCKALRGFEFKFSLQLTHNWLLFYTLHRLHHLAN